MTRITTPKDEPTVDYPQAVVFREKQESIFWPSTEIKVEKDVQDIKVNMTEAERHAVITTLKLFTKYELIIGDEFWLDKVRKAFPRPEIEAMAALFGAIELSVHSPFYSKINEELGLATDEFYNEWKDDPVLHERIRYVGQLLHDDDLLYSLGAFTFIEGAVLYSSFAFLKHFQTAGKNKLLNVVSGINFSARDEALHSEAAGWLFQTLLQESGVDPQVYEEKMREVGERVLKHECAIIDKLFEKGQIEGVTDVQLYHFVQSRINVCLRNMGFKDMYKVDYNPIGETFYKSINGYAMNDFFSSVGNQYSRGWSTEGFKF